MTISVGLPVSCGSSRRSLAARRSPLATLLTICLTMAWALADFSPPAILGNNDGLVERFVEQGGQVSWRRLAGLSDCRIDPSRTGCDPAACRSPRRNHAFCQTALPASASRARSSKLRPLTACRALPPASGGQLCRHRPGRARCRSSADRCARPRSPSCRCRESHRARCRRGPSSRGSHRRPSQPV
jgi:hypothetical protein